MLGHQELWGVLLVLGQLLHSGKEKIIRAKNLLGLSQRQAGCLCSVNKTERPKHCSLEKDLHSG